MPAAQRIKGVLKTRGGIHLHLRGAVPKAWLVWLGYHQFGLLSLVLDFLKEGFGGLG